MIHTPRRRFTTALSAVLAACLLFLSASLAQDADDAALTEVLSDTTVTFYDDLPANDGRVLAESTAGQLPTQDSIHEASYVEVTLDDRTYLFSVAGVAEGKEVTLEMAVDTPPAGGESAITLENAIQRLSAALENQEDALLTSRREGDANVITGVYDIGDTDPTLEVEAEAGTRLLLIRGGESTLHTVDEAGATLGDLTVRTGDTSTPLVTDEGWQEPAADGQAGDDIGLGRALER